MTTYSIITRTARNRADCLLFECEGIEICVTIPAGGGAISCGWQPPPSPHTCLDIPSEVLLGLD